MIDEKALRKDYPGRSTPTNTGPDSLMPKSRFPRGPTPQAVDNSTKSGGRATVRWPRHIRPHWREMTPVGLNW